MPHDSYAVSELFTVAENFFYVKIMLETLINLQINRNANQNIRLFFNVERKILLIIYIVAYKS